MAPASSTLAPGYRFCPPDRELTDDYLPKELAGKPVPGCIHNVDVYSADPEHLVEKLAHAPGTKPPVWYFFSPVSSAAGRKTAGGRKARAVIGGTWHQENKKAVKGSTLGGCVKTYTYVNKTSSGTPERWIMKEFDIPPQNGGGDRVLCKIYRTPRPTKSRSSSSTTTSSSFVSDNGDSRKRKAASDHPDTPTPSVRRRDDEDYFPENMFMEGSSEFEHYYGTATHTPGGEMTKLPQESYLPSSEFYGTTETQGSDLEVPPSMELAPESFFPSSDFYGTSNTQGQGNDDNFAENVRHVFMNGSGEFKHYGAVAHCYGTATHVPGGETIELPPCMQESYLPSPDSEFYGAMETQGGDMEVPPSMEFAPESFFPSSDFYGTTNTLGQGNNDNFTENVEHVFMQGSGESEHYDTAANYYRTTTQYMPGGEATQLLPCVQESFLSSSEFYWTSAAAEMQGGDIDLDDLLKPPTDTTNYQLSEEEIEALILEVTN
ncbi:hypothetical protein ACQ4PT_023944 [Festuca glaucescens]